MPPTNIVNIRLIEFFHNSLFRTLKDFTPARTNLATGVVIKPHLLERPVIYRSEPTFTSFDITASIPSYYFQMIVGIYVVEMIVVLTILCNNLENGFDKISEKNGLGKNLFRSTLLYTLI